MRSYPIYNRIQRDGEKPTQFGARSGFGQTIYVGSGPQNSHELAHLRVDLSVDRVGRNIFTLSVDGEIVKTGVYEPETCEFNFRK